MRYLLDTHIFLWMISLPAKLSINVNNILSDGKNLLYLSSISGFEIAIKYKIGKLKLPESPFTYLKKKMKKYNIEELPLHLHHAAYTANIPEIHKDPFDRLLIAQALIEKMPFISNDDIIRKYPDVMIMM